MRKTTTIALIAATLLLVTAASAVACEFQFNYASIAAPLGTIGEIGVRVQKTHNNCTLASMEDYQFAWENIQVLGETAWEEIGPNLYEKWFQVSLSQVGDGYFMISKDCTKEGYEEATLPISILEPAEEGIWHQAFEGAYPLEIADGVVVESALGDGAVIDGMLTIDQLTLQLPVVPAGFEGELGAVRVFFIQAADSEIVPLLVVSERFFLRFGHLDANAT